MTGKVILTNAGRRYDIDDADYDVVMDAMKKKEKLVGITDRRRCKLRKVRISSISFVGSINDAVGLDAYGQLLFDNMRRK